jgi:hypothetical protein
MTKKRSKENLQKWLYKQRLTTGKIKFGTNEQPGLEKSRTLHWVFCNFLSTSYVAPMMRWFANSVPKIMQKEAEAFVWSD